MQKTIFLAVLLTCSLCAQAPHMFTTFTSKFVINHGASSVDYLVHADKQSLKLRYAGIIETPGKIKTLEYIINDVNAKTQWSISQNLLHNDSAIVCKQHVIENNPFERDPWTESEYKGLTVRDGHIVKQWINKSNGSYFTDAFTDLPVKLEVGSTVTTYTILNTDRPDPSVFVVPAEVAALCTKSVQRVDALNLF